MGNGEGKISQVMSKLSETERQALQAAVNKSEVKGRLTKDVILKKLQFPAGGDIWLSSLWAFISKQQENVGLDELTVVYEVMVYGNVEDVGNVISNLLRLSKLTKKEFSLWLVQGAEVSSPAWKYWQQIQCNICENAQHSFVDFLCHDHNGKTFGDLETWLMRRPIILDLLKAILRYGFQCSEGHENQLFPVLVDVDPTGPRPSIMSSTEVLFLNSILPHDLACEWRLLFSTSRHGQSFSTLVSKIITAGPNVIIVRDTDGHVFGGFASVSWTIGPNFAGDERCFLFSLKPKMAIYVSKGYNDHYMYLNQQQATLPNGLGMGGQHEYFGLWLDAEFGKGHSSQSCTTYSDYSQLSKNQQFQVDHVEVWAVGRPRLRDPSDDEGNKRSILDRDPGAKAILEMIDRGQHSEGLREPDPVD